MNFADNSRSCREIVESFEEGFESFVSLATNNFDFGSDVITIRIQEF